MPIEFKVEGTKEISNALVEIFSPITNILGTLGDRVRIYRELSLLRSLKRAQEIASEEGLILEEPPLKFLIPYMEECSLESPEDNVMIEMWSRLLASSASDFKSEHNLFIRILREMTTSEAKLLEYIVSENTHKNHKDSWHIEDAVHFWYDPYIYIRVRDCIASLPEPLSDDTDFEELQSLIHEATEQPGSIVHYLEISKGEKNVYPMESIYTSDRGPIDDDFERTSISILKSLGIIESYTSAEFWFGEYLFVIHSYHATELGIQFVKTCTNLIKNNNK
ncbi:DUF4393 domain-containing protein [Pseudomonas sp. IC_126]|uniref:Abi-alpha family protein n=1 Tax=Pseudomonas sp. IC_126 TaxID=2547400 RepID=UPI00103C676F|nr:Abi-alpha family protein [Pseudomonas sp. IC_126]TCD22318.1 DUF4393 domain-containing protein [Pseudomonas sp. IC_126]